MMFSQSLVEFYRHSIELYGINMSFEIQFTPEAAEDYTSPDGSLKKQVNEKTDKL
jgi:hypothetical protein